MLPIGVLFPDGSTDLTVSENLPLESPRLRATNSVSPLISACSPALRLSSGVMPTVVIQIRARYSAGEVPTRLSDDYNVTPENVWLIVTGRKWRHVPGAVVCRPRKGVFKMTPGQIAEARRLRAEGLSYSRIAKRFGVVTGTVHRILTTTEGES
jgi:hypothetical protein